MCYSRVGSRVLTHAYTSLAPERWIDIIVSLTSPKLVRLNLCERRLFTYEKSYDYRATDSHGKNHLYNRLVGVQEYRLGYSRSHSGIVDRVSDLSSKTKFQSTVFGA